MKKNLSLLVLLLVIVLGGCLTEKGFKENDAIEVDPDVTYGAIVESEEELKKFEKIDFSTKRSYLPNKHNVLDSLGITLESRSQGDVGSCTAWATAYAKSIIEAKENGWSLDPQKPNEYNKRIFSPSFIYNNIKNGSVKGMPTSSAINFLRDNGISHWDHMPYTTNTSTWPSNEAYQNALNYRIKGFKYLDNTSDMKRVLVQNKPVILAVRMRFVENKNNNYWRFPSKISNKTSGHAICVVGYDDSREAFLFINSWNNWPSENIDLGFDGSYKDQDLGSGYGWLSYHIANTGSVVGFVIDEDKSVKFPENNYKNYSKNTVNWNLVDGIGEYEIYESNYKFGTYKKVASVKPNYKKVFSGYSYSGPIYKDVFVSYNNSYRPNYSIRNKYYKIKSKYNKYLRIGTFRDFQYSYSYPPKYGYVDITSGFSNEF